MSGHLELLTHSMVSLARGRNLATITGSQTINSFLSVKDDLELTSYALYMIELVNQFTEDSIEDYPLFNILLEAMGKLSAGKNNDLVLRYFEVKLLDNLGYRPQLKQCVSCRTQLQPIINYFCPGAGGMLCPACSHNNSFSYPLSVNGLKVFRMLQDEDYDTIRRIKMTEALASELERLIRAYIKFLLEKDIKSIVWMETIKKQERRS
jgi:DNA repair protein RecO (recombination protein O)